MAGALGKIKKAEKLYERAIKFKEKFSAAFWSQKKSIFSLALAEEKQPCNLVTSNAGHCLFSGIATPEQAALVAQKLLSDDMFSGWGIRTLSTNEFRYN